MSDRPVLTESMLNAAGDELVTLCAPKDRYEGIEAFVRALDAAWAAKSPKPTTPATPSTVRLDLPYVVQEAQQSLRC